VSFFAISGKRRTSGGRGVETGQLLEVARRHAGGELTRRSTNRSTPEAPTSPHFATVRGVAKSAG
jgi:hypothetical protein